MSEVTKVISGGIEYSREDLMTIEPGPLRALLHERTHHNIEVPFYATLARWKGQPIANFGKQAEIVFDVWRERGLPEGAPDIEWVKEYLALAKKIRVGERFEWTEPLPTPFTEEEMDVVNKLIYGRRSIRDWLDKPVPDNLIEKILEAGRAAPIGCNLGELRFIVLKDPEEKKMIWSDISTQNAVIIVICYDTRLPKVVGQDTSVPQNAGFDAAAAGDHMLLMAHALGLGGVWLTERKRAISTADRFKEQYGLPDYIEVALHIAVGWTVIGTIKSKRTPLSDMMLYRSL